MPKPNKKERTEAEYYRGIIRELKKENGTLKKQIRSLEKRANHFDDSQVEAEEFKIEDNRSEPCPDCGKGKLEEFDVVGRFWKECDLCNYRTKTVKK